MLYMIWDIAFGGLKISAKGAVCTDIVGVSPRPTETLFHHFHREQRRHQCCFVVLANKDNLLCCDWVNEGLQSLHSKPDIVSHTVMTPIQI